MQRLSAGEWGEVRRVSSLCLWPRSFACYARNSWAGRIQTGDHLGFDSPVSNVVAHFAMMMLRFDAPSGKTVAHPGEAQADLRRTYPIRSFDPFTLRSQTMNGVDFRFARTHACRETGAAEIVIQTEHARLYSRPHAETPITDVAAEALVEETRANDTRRSISELRRS